ncbi:CcmD family protein [Deferribacter thermophilus]
MKNLWYLFSAYLIIWILISGYIFKLSSKIKELKLKIDSIEYDKE